MEAIRALMGLFILIPLLILIVLFLHALMGWWILLGIPFLALVFKTFGPAQKQQSDAKKMQRQLKRDDRNARTAHLAQMWQDRQGS